LSNDETKYRFCSISELATAVDDLREIVALVEKEEREK
jgi:hypothetical protein